MKPTVCDLCLSPTLGTSGVSCGHFSTLQDLIPPSLHPVDADGNRRKNDDGDDDSDDDDDDVLGVVVVFATWRDWITPRCCYWVSHC